MATSDELHDFWYCYFLRPPRPIRCLMSASPIPFSLEGRVLSRHHSFTSSSSTLETFKIKLQVIGLILSGILFAWVWGTHALSHPECSSLRGDRRDSSEVGSVPTFGRSLEPKWTYVFTFIESRFFFSSMNIIYTTRISFVGTQKMNPPTTKESKFLLPVQSHVEVRPQNSY